MISLKMREYKDTIKESSNDNHDEKSFAMKYFLSNLVFMLRNLLVSFFSKRNSDAIRWSKKGSLSPEWDSRTIQMANLVPPGTTVLEFGAGRMILAKHLPPGCMYKPSDIVDRGSGTFICDLNDPVLPTFPDHQVAFFSGVLEYVQDIPRLIDHLSSSTKVFVLSYSCNEEHSNKITRRASGWINDLDSQTLINIFIRNGYRLDFTGSWRSQKIFRFIKSE